VIRLPRHRKDEQPSWSPFARNDGADHEAVALALLRAVEHADCPLCDLTPSRYSDVRRRRPQIGLPRETTLTAVCGSWARAVEAAERQADRVRPQQLANPAAA